MTDDLTIPAGLLQRYEIQREIGQGATGTVFLANDVFDGREVAIKLAHPHIFRNTAENAITHKAWLKEVHLARKLKHPYIVEVLDAGIGVETAWLVMEYLPNGTLEPYTEADKLKPVLEVLEITYKCASALDYACRNGIIHRDIKPANLQYVGPGEAKICDFGAAYWSRDTATQIMDIGSLAYMSPELFKQVVTPQADIYALGVVLFSLLTARLPFEAINQAGLMYAIMSGERPALRDLRPGLPDGLEHLVDKMMARDMDQRFQNWGEVMKAYTDLLPQIRTNPAFSPALQSVQPAQAETYDHLRALPLFEDLNDAQLWELMRLSRWYRIPKGSVLIAEGVAAKSFCLLLEGEAKVTLQGKLIGRMNSGSLFGELAYAEKNPAPRTATVIAGTDVTVGKWSYAGINSASSDLQTKMLRIFFRMAADRIKQINKQFLRLQQQQIGDQHGAKVQSA